MGVLKNQSGYVLFMVVSMITALCILFITILNVYRVRYSHVIKYANRTKARYLAEAGVEKIIFLFSEKGIDKVGYTYKENLGNRQGFEAQIYNNGGYIEIKSTGFYIKEKKTINATLGERIPKSLESAVQINTPKKDIVIGGRNAIIGDVALIDGKFFSSKISGMKFKGEKAFTGKLVQKKVPDTLYDNGIKDNIKELKEKYYNIKAFHEVVHASLYFSKENPFKRHFFKGKSIYVEGNLNILDSCEVTGPCEFVVERSFFIENNAKIRDCRIICGNKAHFKDNSIVEDVFIYAKSGGSITDNVSFSGQFLSEDSIILKNNSHSVYPCFFYSLPRIKNMKLQGGVFLMGNNNVEGVIAVGFREMASLKYDIPNEQRFMYISGSSEVHGIVFNNYSTEYRGKILGHITTGRFILETRKKSYGNLLMNTSTDREALSGKMVLPMVFSLLPLVSVLRIRE